MNIYDKAYELAKSLKELPEYKEYQRLAEIIKKDSNTLEILLDFRKKNYEIQKMQLAGKTVDPKKIEEGKKLYEIIKLNKYANDFLAMEYRLGKIILDLQRILGESIKMEFPVEDITH
ncbi:Cell fate regulator YlbF, YheA/YmcA/DUF963 family (controls sporulation, competence, biofilm development) [Anaerobranca californiensis DSM 14826]|jgi:cell fate (sporulation/competence/biofilm development) regulator YlbF (YheA/YmcA/DUF963 family)|uniref:Cell fate regulator YlbF, YheA/YmcA/DUF963 family (Controls sporulation, competence, biofilm development) n=1 Tax=Anaerobranca californiensis DSM 14826 TaxID=1120989 RepID=A0A1M6PPX9_9FIRM|nr:YlbF family regulator [Anaerobranca californiensis]SHK09987.1 Cell fate regulator YlbF, YheA/YmcA/DUF963 family (controls sporulation, competence, biofilm development) [Anaerobranca californiensis DSM 14826]